MKIVYLLLILYIVTTQAAETCTCPEVCENKEELGRGTWKLLHDIVKVNDDTIECRGYLSKLMDTLSMLYPCMECRKHMQQFISYSINSVPPKLPECTSQWMCDFHNVVNQRLNKPIFNCSQLG